MTNITLSVPEDIKKDMEKFPEINWSEVARAAIRRKVILLKEMDKLLSKSELTKEDSIILSKKLKQAVAKKYLNLKTL